ncbi:hypothetical protein ACPPVO_35600 [Dactylosporangium sp. McL0621]
MFRIARRRAAAAGVQFCDSCAEVTTADERARRRYETAVAQAQSWALLR